MVSIRQVASPEHITGKIHHLLDQMELKLFAEPSTVFFKPGAWWWMAYDGDKSVGFTGAKFEEEFNTLFLARSGVFREYRGQGIQRRFIRVRENLARRREIPRIATYTSHDNIQSANNLIKCGYRIYQPPFLWGCAGAIYFEKRIGLTNRETD